MWCQQLRLKKSELCMIPGHTKMGLNTCLSIDLPSLLPPLLPSPARLFPSLLAFIIYLCIFCCVSSSTKTTLLVDMYDSESGGTRYFKALGAGLLDVPATAPVDGERSDHITVPQTLVGMLVCFHCILVRSSSDLVAT